MAGGRSTRFGRDKAGVEINGAAMLDRAVELLSAVVADVFVSIRHDQADDHVRSKHRLLVDVQENLGPMSGLVAAHRHLPAHAWLALACDMPLMDIATLRELIAQRDAKKPATAFRSPVDGGPEPLCAIYEPNTLADFTRQVEAGRPIAPREQLNQMRFCEARVTRPEALGNVNRPEDLNELVRALEKKR